MATSPGSHSSRRLRPGWRLLLEDILTSMAAYAPPQYWVPAVKGVNDREERETWWYVKELRALAGLESSDESWPGPLGLATGPHTPTTLPGPRTTRGARQNGSSRYMESPDP